MRNSVIKHEAPFAACLFVVATVLHPNPLFAKKVEVQAAGCDMLNIDEIARLVDIELSGSVKGDLESVELVVRLECYAETVKVVITDTSTKRSVQREIVPMQRNIQERVVALSISQLISASLEEWRASEEPSGIKDSNPPVKSASAEREDLEKSPEKNTPNISREYDLVLTGGTKLRLSNSLFVGAAGLRSDLLLASKWGVGLIVEIEAGSTSRKPGTVTTMAAWGGLAGLGRFLLRGPFYLDTGFMALMGYGYLKGRPEVWASGRSAGGMTGEFTLFLAPAVKLHHVLLSIVLKGGYTIENPVGLVSNDKDVTIGGFWIGADLGIGFKIGTGK
jgi:hypothetical protein